MQLLMAQRGQTMWYGNGHMVGMHWGWWIFWLLVLALLVTFVIRAKDGRGTPSGPASRSAEDVLKERFAKGEIAEDEYQERLRILRES